MEPLNLPKIVVRHADIDKFGHVRVKPGDTVELTVAVTNRCDVIDAFVLSLLGIEQGQVTTTPSVLSLFPEELSSAEVEFTVPSDFAAGSCTLWLKATSLTDPSMQAVEAVTIVVAEVSNAVVNIDPESLLARRQGRFGVTVENTGNTRLDLLYVGDDPENQLTMTFVPAKAPPIEPGTTASVQAIVHGKRAFTGSPTQRQFSITARAPGFESKVSATLSQRPYVPGLGLMIASVLLMFGLWAVVVGAAIDSVIDDTDSDIAASLEDGIDAAIDNLEDPTAADEAKKLADKNIARGIAPSTSPFRGEALSSAGGLSTAQSDAAAPVVDAPSDALIGSVVVSADGALNTPIAGVKVTIQALIEDEPLRGDSDPNVQPIELTTDETGRYQVFDLISGLYSVTFDANGFVPAICAEVTVPTDPTQPLANCTTNVVPLSPDPGPASVVRLIGEAASIAGVVTFEGVAQPGAQVAVARLDPVTGTATEPILRTTGPDGRFDVGFARSATDPKTPGTFEVLVTLTRPAVGDIPEQRFMPNRLLVPLAGDEHKIGIEFAMAPETPTTTTTTTTTTLPAAERTLFGRVEDASVSGSALPNAQIQVSGVSNTYLLSSVADGSYYQDGLAPGAYNLRVSAPGYDTQSVSVTVPQTVGSVIRLNRSLVALSGAVNGQAAADSDPTRLLPFAPVPIGGALISVRGDVVAITNGAGEWRTSRAFDLSPVVVQVSAPGYLTASATAAPLPPNDFRFANTIVLVPIDSWVAPVGTPVSVALPQVELECGAAGLWAAPTGPDRTVSATWAAPPGSTSTTVLPLSATLVQTGDRTTIAFRNVPRRGSLTLTFSGIPATLMTSTIEIPNLATPTAPLSLAFAGSAGLRDSQAAPVPDLVVGSPCPNVSSASGLPPGARSFVVSGLESGRSTFVVTQLEPGVPVTVMTATATMTATPTAGVPFSVLTL